MRGRSSVTLTWGFVRSRSLETSVRPSTAYYSRELADFVLPYESVRSLPSPDDVVLEFFQSVYDAGADAAHWDRAAVDRPAREWS